MSNHFDDAELPIHCPSCGRETKKSIRWIQDNTEFICDCGTLVTFNADDLRDATGEADRAIDDFKRGLENL